ncbi:3-(3-hydroxy-phenyl)propionate/3-hydroxycinnamic acid hydroxylase [Grimontia celer]|uniref:3-(3-hydroxy-phenyl)propionate/3-hydroxycinnamic acid hydroxylase n=1 Tax=Grimontia celer TaxID=1796497 RepID=A0A128F590_9GAMM|nr:FAD-dependent oxidoreductase [Grimontia celer]CZF81630.1 3-(3-hydroxy-phenyl)propionate/3-hydroxycinnamic acid hydroxylase [Grimontia celer]
MLSTYTNPVYSYSMSKDQQSDTVTHHKVVIIGGGPAGLSMAIDLAKQGVESVVLDDNNTVSVGSRAICFAKRTLEIMNRYGCAERMVSKGITWKKGKVFFGNEKVYEFDLLPEEHHKLPAFINLQQYYFEEYLVDVIETLSEVDLRWKNKVQVVDAQTDINLLTVDTPDGTYQISCDYLIVADGANSPIRTKLGLESKGQVFQDRFLIADVVMKADFPTERWFWFEPPFHPEQSALLHRQADNVWRIDLQLGWDADPEWEKREENIRPRIEAMLGSDKNFDLEWASVYTFQCRKIDDFIHKRVIFVGDAAHQVSPFGARGANGAVQSVENLAWKLCRVLNQTASPLLLRTYNDERQFAAEENILNSTRATDFITPKSIMSKVLRNATLELAKSYPFARPLINSGRLSTPCTYRNSTLNTPDKDTFNNVLIPGSPILDAPVNKHEVASWLLDWVGNHFVIMIAEGSTEQDKLLAELAKISDLEVLLISRDQKSASVRGINKLTDKQGLLHQRYDLSEGTAYLFRPDQVITARWRQPAINDITEAMQRALGHQLEKAQ